MSRVHQIGVRLGAEAKAALDAATDRARDPYAPSVTQVVERGIILAAQEIAAKRGEAIQNG